MPAGMSAGACLLVSSFSWTAATKERVRQSLLTLLRPHRCASYKSLRAKNIEKCKKTLPCQPRYPERRRYWESRLINHILFSSQKRKNKIKQHLCHSFSGMIKENVQITASNPLTGKSYRLNISIRCSLALLIK